MLLLLEFVSKIYIINIGDNNMNSTYKQCLLQSKYTFQVIRNNESYIFVRNRNYSCFHDNKKYIVVDGKDNEVITSKDKVEKYFNIIG